LPRRSSNTTLPGRRTTFESHQPDRALTMNGKHAGWMLVLALVAAQARAETEEAVPLPPGAEVVSVEAYPERVELGGRYAYRQLLVLGTLATGETVDLTRVVVRENEPQ